MFDQEEAKPKTTAYSIGQVLDDYSVDQLNELIGELEEEIERVKAELAAKSSSLNAADALFKK